MLDWLGELRPALARRDAYLLLSAAADVRVTQMVNGVSRGCHVILEKSTLPPIAASVPAASSGPEAAAGGEQDRKRPRAV